MKSDLGIVVGASASSGIKILLRNTVNVEDLEIGSLGLVKSSRRNFLVMIDDIIYDIKEPSLYKEADHPIIEKALNEFVRESLIEAYLSASVIAYNESESTRRGGRVPEIGSKLYPLTHNEITLFYGSADWNKSYPLGNPKTIGKLDEEIPVSLSDLFNLNFGIFGKAGTGKTYLANLLLAYGILYNQVSEEKINFLVFDMQGEYSFEILDDRGNKMGDGVGRVFPDEFKIYVVDEDYISKYSDVYPIRLPLIGLSREELEYIIQPLNPPEGFKNNLASLKKMVEDVLSSYKNDFENIGLNLDKDHWILGFLVSDYTIDKIVDRMKRDPQFIEVRGSLDEIKEKLYEFYNKLSNRIRDKGPALFSSYEAGSRRLQMLLDLPISFIARYKNTIADIAKNLYEGIGEHVIICFGGRWSRTTMLYLALANLIAYHLRRIIDESIAKGGKGNRKIIIFLEEAHRFLGKETYQFNPFGKLAREYRKFGVSIVPIDQKPSELDPDVTAMLWTKIVFNMVDSRDIESALIGIEDPVKYKRIIPILERGEALIHGVGISMPVVLKLINYGKYIDVIRSKYNSKNSSTFTTKDLLG